jgi:peptide/nickel transport system ATP-binding protein
MAARPRDIELRGRADLTAIPGQVRSPLDRTPGCPFAARCARVAAACLPEVPPIREIDAGHRVACERPL